MMRIAKKVLPAVVLAILSLHSLLTTTPAQQSASPARQQAGQAAKQQRPRRPKPPATGLAIGENKATPVEKIKAMKGFQVELLYSVPAAQQGSWVNLCLDNKGRFIVSDQYGGLYRFPPPPPGKPLDPATIEKVPAEIRAANGLLWAFDSLYVAVNDYESKIDSGLYRVTDSDGDDQLDRVELLRAMQARGDHGVHAVLLAPDGKGNLHLVQPVLLPNLGTTGTGPVGPRNSTQIARVPKSG
jgi:hypothetical protein